MGVCFGKINAKAQRKTKPIKNPGPRKIENGSAVDRIRRRSATGISTRRRQENRGGAEPGQGLFSVEKNLALARFHPYRASQANAVSLAPSTSRPSTFSDVSSLVELPKHVAEELSLLERVVQRDVRVGARGEPTFRHVPLRGVAIGPLEERHGKCLDVEGRV